MVTKKVCVLGWSTFELFMSCSTLSPIQELYTRTQHLCLSCKPDPKQITLSTPYVILKVMRTHWLCLACKTIQQCNCKMACCLQLKRSGFAPDRECGTWERDHAVDLLRSTKGCGYDLVAHGAGSKRGKFAF